MKRHVILAMSFLAAGASGALATDLAAPIPVDPAVTVGELPNGLRYYIRENAKPEQRAALWLVIGAGAVDEDDDQLGLAHMTEHMAFNGTANFPRTELVSYLESIGMQFGPEVNAYTSQDETVYMLQVPTDQPELLAKGLQILEEWAHRISFEDAEIDKERGVIVEEWRLGRGADERMYDAQLPIIFHGSRYAARNTIGDPEIIKSFPYDTIRRFYRDWYRPDLMAVVAVGDFDKAAVEAAIRERFAGIPRPAAPRPRLQPPVPDHDATLFAVTTDPEASSTFVSVLIKHAPDPETTVADYRRSLLGMLANTMLRNRFAELSRQADPPFSNAFANDRRQARTKSFYTLAAVVQEDGVARGLEALMTEVERARRHGFTGGELDRAKAEFLRQAEQMAAEKDKTESQRFARAYQTHFLRGTPYTGPEQRLALVQELLPTITLAEVDARLREMITTGSRVVTVEAPQRDDLAVPGESELAAILAGVAARDIPAYVDATVDAPLVPAPPPPAPIVARAEDAALGTTTWTLANGVRVVLKPTTFKNDEILLWAVSPGGSSLIGDDGVYPRVSNAAGIVAASGVGAFDPTALQKKLAGKIVRVWPYVSSLEEGLRGSASPQDLETMLQMVYLLVTAPREDQAAFSSMIERQRSFLQNRSADPEAAFRDTITTVVNGYHPRRLPPNVADLDRLDLAGSLAFYRDRFGDCGDFTVLPRRRRRRGRGRAAGADLPRRPARRRPAGDLARRAGADTARRPGAHAASRHRTEEPGRAGLRRPAGVELARPVRDGIAERRAAHPLARDHPRGQERHLRRPGQRLDQQAAGWPPPADGELGLRPRARARVDRGGVGPAARHRRQGPRRRHARQGQGHATAGRRDESPEERFLGRAARASPAARDRSAPDPEPSGPGERIDGRDGARSGQTGHRPAERRQGGAVAAGVKGGAGLCYHGDNIGARDNERQYPS